MIIKRYGLTPDLMGQNDWFICGSDSGEPSEWIYLGKLSEYGQRHKVKFDISKEKVVAIVGKRGQGKSYTLGSLIEGLCTKELNTTISSTKKQRGVILFDTLNIFQWMNIQVSGTADQSDEMKTQSRILKTWNLDPISLDVDVWIPKGYRFKLSSPNFKDLCIKVSDFSLDDWSAIFNIDIVREIKGQYFTEVFQKVVNIGWEDTNNEFHNPNVNYSISDLINCIQNDKDNELSIYRPETRRAIMQQLRSYEMHPMFNSPGTSLQELIKPGRISVILINSLPEDLRGVLVSVIIRRLLQERAGASQAAKDLLINSNLNKSQIEERIDFIKNSVPKSWVVIDEAQNIIPAGKYSSATESLIKFVKEGRNFGLSFIVTTQQPKSLDPNILSQVETFIIHKLVSLNDIEYILDNLKSPLPSEIKDNHNKITMKDLIRDISVGQAVLSDTNTARAFILEIRPRVSAHGGFEA